MSRYVDATEVEHIFTELRTSPWFNDNTNGARIIREEAFGIVEHFLFEAPTIDLVCKDCKNHEDFPTGISPITCSLSWGGVFENDFCSYGVRKEGEE